MDIRLIMVAFVSLFCSLGFFFFAIKLIKKSRKNLDLLDYSLVILGSALLVLVVMSGKSLIWIIGITVVGTLFCLEQVLRKIVARDLRDNRITSNPEYWSSSLETARKASEDYPRFYMSQEFFEVMKQRDESELKSRTVTILQTRKRDFVSSEFKSEDLNVEDGLRVTTDSPANATRKVLIFGGSTVFCSEVPDKYTVASFLQRSLNFMGSNFRVVNHGQRGATTLNRIRLIQTLSDLEKGDIAIFLFGDNDCGTYLDQKRHSLTRVIVLLERVSDYGIEIFKWINGELSPILWRRRAKASANKLVVQFEVIKDFCQRSGINFMCVLQPNLFTLKGNLDYAIGLKRVSSREIKVSVETAYLIFESWVITNSYTVSATHIFDDVGEVVYLDWAHLNARGNEYVARFILDQILSQKLLTV
jgi:hypothetical protein